MSPGFSVPPHFSGYTLMPHKARDTCLGVSGVEVHLTHVLGLMGTSSGSLVKKVEWQEDPSSVDLPQVPSSQKGFLPDPV